MPWLTQLADVARRTGYPVTECPGWKTRGHGSQPSVRGIVAHHTAGRDDMHVVRDGRPGLDGPLSQFWLRHDGHIFVVAAGRCWHNAPSTSADHTNSTSIGIEAENNGREAWPDVQVDAYIRLCAELCREFKLPASRVKGHKEVQIGKPDPHTIKMDSFRADVARAMTGDHDMPLNSDDLKKIGDTVFTAVWMRDVVDVSARDPKNPDRMPLSLIQEIWSRADAANANVKTLLAQTAAQGKTIEALAAALAQRDASVDVDALIARIKAEIASVEVHLVTDEA